MRLLFFQRALRQSKQNLSSTPRNLFGTVTAAPELPTPAKPLAQREAGHKWCNGDVVTEGEVEEHDLNDQFPGMSDCGSGSVRSSVGGGGGGTGGRREK